MNKWIGYNHSFKRCCRSSPAPRADLEEGCGGWIQGPTGIGKGYTARSENPEFFDKPISKCWDGYRGEEVVIVDDVVLHHKEWFGETPKRWADRYSFPAEQKGTTVSIWPRKIVVTSQSSLGEMLGHDAPRLHAMQRRCTVRDHKNKKESREMEARYNDPRPEASSQ